MSEMVERVALARQLADNLYRDCDSHEAARELGGHIWRAMIDEALRDE